MAGVTCSYASSASASTRDIWSHATRLPCRVNAICCKLQRRTGTLAKSSLRVEDLGDPHFACSCCPLDALAASCLLDHQCHLHTQAAAHALIEIDQHTRSNCICNAITQQAMQKEETVQFLIPSRSHILLKTASAPSALFCQLPVPMYCRCA